MEMRNAYKILVKNPKGRDHSHDMNVDEKVKVKLSLCLTKHHTMKAYWGVEV
jgi:hypothetical protein